MRKTLQVHFALVLLPAVAVTYMLYAYKERHYTAPALVLNAAVNLLIWIAIFAAIDLVLMLLVKLVRCAVKLGRNA